MSRRGRVAPDVSVVGTGDPVAAVVGGLHGDEPSGVRAIERLERRVDRGDLSLRRAVKLIVANPPACDADRRFIEGDLNRSFPGDPEGNLEERLAPQVLDAIGEVPALALHATRSHDEPFAFVDPTNPELYDIASSLPVPYLVRTDRERIGALGEHAAAITVEAGRQGRDVTVDAAVALSEGFLKLTDALAGRPPPANPREFVVGDAIEKPPADSYAVHVDNFERVEPGEVFATADGAELVASEVFHPILLSADGYDDIFGFRGTLYREEEGGPEA